MTQNSSNNEELQKAYIQGLNDHIDKANIKIAMHEALWVTSQKVLGEHLATIKHLNAQVEFFKQEFTDASNQHLKLLMVVEALKKNLDNLLDSMNNLENK